MKPNAAPGLRFARPYQKLFPKGTMKLCWFYRNAISWCTDSPAPTPSWLQRHLRGCPDCQNFYQREQQLIAALRRGAAAQVPSSPAFLQGKILAALAAPGNETAPRRTIKPWIWATLIPAVGTLAILAHLAWRPPAPEHVSSGADTPPLRIPPEPFAKASPAELLAWTQRLDEPLRREFQFVVNDAAAAFNSVAGSFLPQTGLTP